MKKLSPEEKGLWKRLTEDIKPLVKESPLIFYNPRLDKHGIRTPIAQRKLQQEKESYLPFSSYSSSSSSSGTFSSKQIKALKKVQLEGTLDLHGYTRAEAWDYLQRFFSWAQSQKWQWVLVITGKGPPQDLKSSSPSRGILKQELPLWLNQHPMVGGFCQAKPQHGGQGAFYVRLKKASS